MGRYPDASTRTIPAHTVNDTLTFERPSFWLPVTRTTCTRTHGVWVVLELPIIAGPWNIKQVVLPE